MEAPIYVYYELRKFYQNHRSYVKSRSFDQLKGGVSKALSGAGLVFSRSDAIAHSFHYAGTFSPKVNYLSFVVCTKQGNCLQLP